MRTAVTALALCLAAGAAAAQPQKPAPAETPKFPPHTVSGVTIAAGDPPRLVGSYPAAGATVPGGVLVIRMTFDEKMSPDGWDVTAAPGATAPACVERPRLLADGKSFVLLCTAAPKGHYEIALNAKGQGFRNEGDREAEAATLAFSTGDAVGPVTVAQAMKAASLTDLDLPVEASPGAIGALGR